MITFTVSRGYDYYCYSTTTPLNTGDDHVSFVRPTYYYSSGSSLPQIGSAVSSNLVGFIAVYLTQSNQPPNPPSGLSVDSTSSTSPTLSWAYEDPDGDAQASLQVVVEDLSIVTTRIEENSPSITKSGLWVNVASPVMFQYGAKMPIGSEPTYAELTFTGDYVKLGYVIVPDINHGLMNVYVDGVLMDQVDTYGGDYDMPFVEYNLEYGQHTLRIDPVDTSKRITLDYIEYRSFFRYDSGEVVSSAPSFKIPASAGLHNDKTYQARVRVKDTNDKWSDWSEPLVWTIQRPYVSSGSYETEPMNVNRDGALNPGVVSWEADLPASTSLVCSYATSDDGQAWGGWTPVENGGEIPNVNWIKFRFNLSTTNTGYTPALHSFTVSYPAEYFASGQWESPVIDMNDVVEGYNSLRSTYESTNPEDTSLFIEYCYSDDGESWSPWENFDAESNEWGHYAKLRIRAYTDASRLTTPAVQTLGLTAKTAFEDEGVWTSAPIDVRHLEFGINSVEWDEILNNGTIKCEARVSDDTEDTFGEWVEIEKGKPLPFNSVTVKYLQLRFTFTRGGRNDTPELDKAVLSIRSLSKKGFWASELVDVSHAKDKTTGKIVSDHVLNGGRLITRYKYSTDGGDTLSAWNDALADGTLVLPPEVTHVKIMHVLLGNDVEVKSSTMFFDGEPSAQELLTNMSPNADYDFTQIRDMVIISNGKDVPRKWSQVDPPEILGGDPPAFQMVETHLNRAWGAGDPENPSRVRYSEILDPEAWPALNFIDFNPEDGDKITALFRYGQVLVVAKRNNIALLVGDRTSNFAVQWLDHDAGVEGFRGIAIVDKYLAYVARDGVRFSDLTKSVRATERLRASWDGLNQRRLNQGAIVAKGNYMLVALPSEG